MSEEGNYSNRVGCDNVDVCAPYPTIFQNVSLM